MKMLKYLILLIFLMSFLESFSQKNNSTSDTIINHMKSQTDISKQYSNQGFDQKALQFKNVGPSRGGRVTAVCGVTDSLSTFYMGATGGGVWKTSDYGNHWKNISDGYFESPSIGAIAVYQKNPNIVYVGTGSDGIRSNVIVGKGMYKSNDAGNSWSHIGLKTAGQIGSVNIHPTNPDIVYIAVIGQPFRKSKERGVYRTKDGGKTWENILFLSDSVGAVDIEFAPDNPNIIYAAMWRGERKPWTIISGDTTGGIFKSTDGGTSWKKIEKGLPQGLIGKIDFAVSADNPERVWALVQAPVEEEGLYRSDNYGDTWHHVKMPDKPQVDIMYRPFYFTNLDANPKDADQLWTGTKLLWTTKDGGKSWNRIISNPHVDHHDMWINPNYPEISIVGNDGGAAVTIDNGNTWSTLFNQNTAELYSCYVDDQYPYYLYSGQQDNSTIRIPSRRPREDVLASNDAHGLNDLQFWQAVGGCETGPVIPKPGNSDIVYANCKGQFGVYNFITGTQQNYYIGAESLYGNHPDDITYRFQRVVPMEVSPFDPNTVFYGSQFLHKTTDGGISWQQISPDLTANKPQYRMRSGGPIDEDISGEEYYNVLYAIAASPMEQEVIYTGSNDGLIQITRNGGKSWQNITPKDLPEDGRVSKIHISNHSKGKAYVTINRDYLGDDKPYIYRTNDYGRSWTKIIKDIPIDFPARVIREDPIREGLLFMGTEFGMFISFDDGLNWSAFQQNLPIVPITDMVIFRNNINISTLGRSFWIMEDISVLREFNPNDKNKIKIYTPAKTIGEKGIIYFTSGDLKDDDVVKICIKNNLNETLFEREDTLKNSVVNNWGIRKFEWHLNHSFEIDKTEYFTGPKVAPGIYTVEMILGEKKFDKILKHELHPNLKEIGTTTADLKEQEALSMKIANLLLEVIRVKNDLEKKIMKAKSEKDREILQKKRSLLIKDKERYDKPMLHEHISYLYKMVTAVPQKLGRDAFTRYDQLVDDFAEYKKNNP